MSDYGLNFGLARGVEDLRYAEGRFRVPSTGTLYLGTVVEIDAANPGYVKQSGANPVPVAGVCGLLLQEDEFLRSVYDVDPMTVDSFQMGVARNGALGLITGGAGVKFWLRNTPGQTRADGRVIAARTTVDVTGLTVADSISWDGSKFIKTSGAGAKPFAAVTALNGAAGYVEAVCLA